MSALVQLNVRGKEVLCKCVGKHVPLPTVLHRHHIVPFYLGGQDVEENVIMLCPNTHYNIHSLLQAYAKYKGTPPGSVRKHYSDFVQDLAKRGWDGRTVRRTAGEVELSEPLVDPWWEEQVE